MTLKERLRQLASALPSDASAIVISRADILAMLEEDPRSHLSTSMRDLTVAEVAHETHRKPSTVRGWLNSRALRGHKFHDDWRVTRAALRDNLQAQATQSSETPGEVDITAWRKGRGI